MRVGTGAYRFITSLQIKAHGKLIYNGEIWVYSGDIPEGATVEVTAGGNFTWGDAPNLFANSSLLVQVRPRPSTHACVWGC